MKELTALKAMLSRSTFLKFGTALFRLDNLQKELKLILQAITKYYDKYRDREDLTVDELQAFFRYLNPSIPDNEVYNHIFSRMREAVVENDDLVADILNRVVEQHYCADIAKMAFDVADGTAASGVPDIEAIIDAYKEASGYIQEAEMDVCGADLDQLLAFDSVDGLPWTIVWLNNTLGRVRKTYLGHIYARPDVGKSSFAVQQCCYWAYCLRATDESILYLNNEEAIQRIKLRGICSFLGQTAGWIHKHPEEARDMWNKFPMEKHLKFIPSVTQFSQVEKYVDYFKPRAVVIDQGAKVDIPVTKSTSGPDRLKILYSKYRELGKESGASIITLGQADDKAEGKKIVHLNNMDGSKVGVPGELDWGLAIGKCHEPGLEWVRWLNIVKNKMLGMYGSRQVNFRPEIARMEDPTERRDK